MSKKYSEKEMEMHREYMKKYKKESSDLQKDKVAYKDHYELLALDRSATHTQIRQAYRKLALKYHPDRNSSPEAQERWEGVPAAYAVISDPNSRAEYDATLPTRDALVSFYKSYNPAKLDNATIQTIIDGWYGREVELFQMLNAKYEIAPHQGINRRASEQLPVEKSRVISRDSMSSAVKGGEVATENTWMESVGSAFCCKNVVQRFFTTPYYEVHTQSPGISMVRQSDTPGQPMHHPTLQSPAAPLDHVVFKKSKSASTPEDETASTAPTEEAETSGSIVDESSCSSTTSTVSSLDTPVK